MIREKYVQILKETTVSIVNSKIESIRLKDDSKTSLRLYKEGVIGVVGAIGKYKESELEAQAREALNMNIEYPCQPSCNQSEAVDKRTDFLMPEALLKEAEEFIYELAEAQPDYIFSGKIMLQETGAKISNDVSLDLEYHDRTLVLEILYKERSSANIIDGVFEYSGRKYDRKLVLEEANHLLHAYKNKVDLPQSGIYPVVFAEYRTPVKKLYTDLNGQLFASGASLFSDQLNKQVFSKDFTLYQSLNPEDVYNIPFFDAEGITNADYRIPLIDEGVIKYPYTDKRTAYKYNIKATGSSAAAYDSVPTLDLLNFKIKESEKTLKELLGGEMGIMVLIASGGDFTPNGDYGSPVQLAMLFDGERFIGRLPEIQISSNVYEMYGSGFRGICSDAVLPISNTKFAVMDMKVSTT